MRPSISERLLQRLGHHYILVMMILTRLFGSTGGLLVIYYVEFTLNLPAVIRHHFRICSLLVVVVGCTLTVLLAMWETRALRRVLRALHYDERVASKEACRAGREAVMFVSRHHWHEAWLVPSSTLLPVLIVLKTADDASFSIMLNVTLAVFMGISMALMSTFFAVEHCMKPVIRRLLDSGVVIDYKSLPPGNLRFRFGLCFTLIIITTALMIGTLARQRASDIFKDRVNQTQAIHNLVTHSTYITFAAVITGMIYSTVLTNSVAKRVANLVEAMERVGSGDLSGELLPTGNDEIDILTRQFNAMVKQLDEGNQTIRDLNSHLEQRVTIRTSQLESTVRELSQAQKRLTGYNTKLELARAEAEKANRAKSEFLANISHDLRTPLNGVIGMTELLLSTTLNVQQQRYVRTAQFSGKTLLELLNSILDFSKIEAGKLELEDIEFDFFEAIEPVIELAAYRSKDQGIEMGCFVDPDIPKHLRGDPARLRQILTNLVNNAVKFTREGNVVVRISHVDHGDDCFVTRFEVHDTGIGIPEERFDRLFQSFSQVDASTTRQYGGTGLGLAICKQLTEMMGGEIGFESKQGLGSTFWFTIPFKKASRMSSFDCPIFRHCEEVRVLVVVDNESCRKVLAEQLTAWGLRAELAADGHTALDALQKAAEKGAAFQMAILDVETPRVDGKALATTIRETAVLSDTILILLHPAGSQADHPQSPAHENWYSVTKPVLYSSFCATMMSVVSKINGGVVLTNKLPEYHDTYDNPAIPKTTRSQTQILLAEDNEINQEVAVEILTQAGFRCDVVRNGVKAVEAVQTGWYDLVLMDCQMPEMDGLEATRRIRRAEAEQVTPKQKPIPIVALTANAIQRDRERCFQAGMTDYLSKPINPIKLIEKIEACLEEAETLPTFKAKAGPDLLMPASCEAPGSAETGTAPSEGILDVGALLERCMGKSELAERVLKKFEHQLPKEFTKLQASIHAKDAEEVAKRAHALKGAAANLSAEAIRKSAAQLESLGRAGKIDEAATWFAQLQTEGDRFLEYLPNVLEQFSVAT